VETICISVPLIQILGARPPRFTPMTRLLEGLQIAVQCLLTHCTAQAQGETGYG